jgi:hypothetical protein
VQLSFERFNTEPGYDFLTVFDGNTSNGARLVRFAGTPLADGRLARSLVGPSNRMFVAFGSDGLENGPGVNATVRFVPCVIPQCFPTSTNSTPLTLNTTSLGVNSPVAASLPNRCTWYIDSLSSSLCPQVHFDVFQFPTTRSTSVTLYRGFSLAPASILDRYSGVLDGPTTVGSPTPAMTVLFVSASPSSSGGGGGGGGVSGNGFGSMLASLTFVPCVACDALSLRAELIQANGTLITSSPPSSGPDASISYGNNRNCSWFFQAPAGLCAGVTFHNFSLEDKFDFVFVSAGFLSSSLRLFQGTGNLDDEKTIFSPSRSILVRFTSDTTNVGTYSGFYATIFSTPCADDAPGSDETIVTVNGTIQAACQPANSTLLSPSQLPSPSLPILMRQRTA